MIEFINLTNKNICNHASQGVAYVDETGRIVGLPDYSFRSNRVYIVTQAVIDAAESSGRCIYDLHHPTEFIRDGEWVKSLIHA